MGKKGTETKERIKNSTRELFAQHGFKAVTMKDICDSMEISRGGLYRYYGSTSEIFQEIFQELAAKTEDWMYEAINQGESALVILERLLEQLVQEMLQKDDSLSLAIYEYSQGGDKDLFQELNERGRKRWITLIQYGIQRGEFRKTDPEQITDLILFSYQGARLWSRIIEVSAKQVQGMVQFIRQTLEG